MKRRTFIKNSCRACLSITALPLIVSSCASMTNTTGKIIADGLTLTTEDFKMHGNDSKSYRSFIIVRNEALKYPICVYRLNEQEYSALWMKCAHQGAELQASGSYLQCPAHGSEFNNKGLVTNGPASTNLKTFPVVVTGNQIFIDLRKQS
jgi:nitrite reductase/ring-hydroxylating ferredoxin subunit